jgi:glycosidase
MTMSVWPRYPTVYEINTWVWLSELSRKSGTSVDLSCVSAAEWDSIADLGFDAVWLMGVWERSPAGIAIANNNASLQADFEHALLDYHRDDNVGSPYCVRRYCVDSHLGGCKGLAAARQELSRRGMRLVLDFVPNHVAPDHPWVTEHPEYFVQGSSEDARDQPASFVELGGHIFACGRDPYFPAWPDVLQLNAFHAGLRQAVIETVLNIAKQCDAIRCDMAMLVLNQIFERTWTHRAGQQPPTEYWTDVITTVKRQYPDFLFIAEAYWDLEWELQQKGFDFCYDKRLYDRIRDENAESVRLHLCADLDYQEKLVRFIENHDEPRAGAAFPSQKQRAAAVTTATLPGARLFHEGQFEGRKVKLPVFLGRRPEEPVDTDLRAFYRKLLKAVDDPVFRDGQWNLCGRSGWPDNSSYQNIVAWSWSKGQACYLVVVNLSDTASQAQVQVPVSNFQGKRWRLRDLLSGTEYDRIGDEMISPGLYVELAGWHSHLFKCHSL